MTNEEIHNMKYKVCCSLCDNVKCVRGTDECEAEIWAKNKAESEDDECKGCYYNDGEVHAECVICDKAESEDKG